MIRASIFIAILLIPVLSRAGHMAPEGYDPRDDQERIDQFSDAPRYRGLEHPAWFKHSFLDLREDLREARLAGKAGIAVYFGQENCGYCQAFFEINLTKPDIVAYVRKHFDIIPLDIFSDREVTDLTGARLSEKDFSIREQTNFTPSLIFYNTDGAEVLRLRGYYPPYKFRAAIEYAVDRHYEQYSFREYLARADPTFSFDEGGLNHDELFAEPPYILDRSRFAADKPLVVVFEQGDCHACDVLHTEPMHEEAIRSRLKKYDVVQLGMWSDTPVLTPDGRKLTAKGWADELGLIYTPTLIFFDEQGKEIVRVDSVVKFHRLKGVLDYVLSKGYLEEPTYLRWAFRQRRERSRQQDATSTTQ